MRVYSRFPATGLAASLVLALSGCTLYNDVVIQPLTLRPDQIDRSSNLIEMVNRADFSRAAELASLIDGKTKKNAGELAALGKAELAAGRFDAARRHLRSALDLGPSHTAYADVAWDLSQVEYLSNNFEASREWTDIAIDKGLNVREWHREVLNALADVAAYQMSGPVEQKLAMRADRPNVPRIETRVNDKPVTGIIDSGAVTTIISEGFAKDANVRRLGTFGGTFLGLLGEPIDVHFGLIDALRLGDMVVRNVPVAIMADKQMSFVTGEQRPFKIDLLLGAALLKEFRLELDFRHHQATFHRLSSLDRQPAADQNLFIGNFQPHVRTTINGFGWYMLVLDTGSEVTYLNDNRLPTVHLKPGFPKVHGALLQGLGGAKKSGEKLESVDIGADRWEGKFKTIPTYSTEQEHSVGILGENFLQHFKVVIDFGRMRLDLIKED
jgi:tetratricopeptide (TPR) repeat protein